VNCPYCRTARSPGGKPCRRAGRPYAQVLRFFDGLELVEPGLVQIQQWRPAVMGHETFSVWAGVARK
jgi:hypothetical protein